MNTSSQDWRRITQTHLVTWRGVKLIINLAVSFDFVRVEFLNDILLFLLPFSKIKNNNFLVTPYSSLH